MIFLYTILIALLSPTIYYIANKASKNSIQTLNWFEKAAFGLVSSFLLFSIYLFIIGILKIPYSRMVVIIPLIINIVFLLMLLITKRLTIEIKITKPDWTIKNIMIIILSMALITYLLYSISTSISNFLLYPDEFSAWALNAKNIFLGKRMDYFINTGLENYPNLLPLLYSGFYFFIDRINESGIRIFSSIYMIICILGLIGIGKRKKINMFYLLTFLLFIIISYDSFFSILSSSYGDIPFLTTYTLGTLYLIEWLVGERKNSYLYISSVNLMSCCFMKTDGLYLMAFTIFLFILFCCFYKQFKLKKVGLKVAVMYNVSILWLPLLWKIYNKLANFPTNLKAGAGSVFELHLEYGISLFQNMTQQFYACLPWVLILCIIIIGYVAFYHKLNREDKQYINMCLLAFLANVVFLILCYLFVFSGEAVIAASFIRYLTRVIMIAVMATLVMLKPFDQIASINSKEKSLKRIKK